MTPIKTCLVIYRKQKPCIHTGVGLDTIQWDQLTKLKLKKKKKKKFLFLFFIYDRNSNLKKKKKKNLYLDVYVSKIWEFI